MSSSAENYDFVPRRLIIILEDEDFMADLYESLFGQNFDLIRFGSIEKFFEFLNSDRYVRPDLVLCDNQLEV